MFKKIILSVILIITSIEFLPSALSATVFTTYIGTGHSIDLASAFTILIYFNMIKEPMAQLPLFMTRFVQLLVSMRRIQEYVDSDEIDSAKVVRRITGAGGVVEDLEGAKKMDESVCI